MDTVIRGDRLRAAREAAGLTQSQLSAISGVGIQQIHRYENGKGDASVSGLKRLAAQLRVSADYLLGLSDDPQGYGALNLCEDERSLIEAYTVADAGKVVELLAARMQRMRGEG